MTHYLAIQKGVYRQGIIGLYDTFEEAKAASLAECNDEPDGYHDVEVVAVEVGVQGELGVVGKATRSVRSRERGIWGQPMEKKATRAYWQDESTGYDLKEEELA